MEYSADAAGIAAIHSRGDCYSFHSPFPVLCTHRDGLVVYANPASTTLLAHWGCAMGDCLPPEWCAIVRTVYDEGLRYDTTLEVGASHYFLSLIPVPVHDCVQIYGYDASEHTQAMHRLHEREREFHSTREALRASEERMRVLQDNLPLGVYRSTPDGRILHANEMLARMLGCTDAVALYTMHTKDFYDEPAQREQIVRVLREHGMIKDWELRMRRIDGTILDVALNVRAVFDAEGRVLFHDGIIADISERKRIQEATQRAKQQAEEASRIKSNFIATMSHELRTPLNGILGFASLLEEDLASQPELAEMAGIIHSSGRRLLDTLNSILDLSIVESGKLAVQPTWVNVTDILEEVAQLYRASAQKKGLQLRILPPESAVHTHTDDRLLRQILNNLLNNAVKYTRVGGITLAAEQIASYSGEGLRIDVEDTGIGISASDREVIFHEFRQASEGYSRAYDGTGLGLSVSQKFAHALGGHITVVSEPGAGSRFSLYLPAATRAPEQGTLP